LRKNAEGERASEAGGREGGREGEEGFDDSDGRWGGLELGRWEKLPRKLEQEGQGREREREEGRATASKGIRVLEGGKR
jgi:hypothetical protein